MIKVKTVKENNNFKRISILGHAMYDDYGKDIVCSAVSSIVITTVNGIISINDKAINYQTTKDGLVIDVLSTDVITHKLLENMLKLLKELELNYKENIDIQ